MDATPKQHHELHYAPRPAVHKQRRFQRWLYLIAVICLVGSSIYWGPLAWHRTQLLYWQRQCMNYRSPAGQLVSEVVDGKQTVKVIPQAWTKFYSLLSPPGFVSDGTCFLSEMKTSNGQTRLVVVDVFDMCSLNLVAKMGMVPMTARVFSPGTIIGNPTETASGNYVFAGKQSHQPKKLQVFAGQIDPRDTTHFTIEVQEINEPRRIVDGWLLNEKIKLEIRELNVSTRPSPSSQAKSE